MVGLVRRSEANLFEQRHSIHKQVNTTSKTWAGKRQQGQCVIKADALLELCGQHKGGGRETGCCRQRTTRRKLCDMIFFLRTRHSKWTKGTADAETTQFWAEQREIYTTADAAFVWHLKNIRPVFQLSAAGANTVSTWLSFRNISCPPWMKSQHPNNSPRKEDMCWQTAGGAARQKARSRAHTVITFKYLNYSFSQLVHNWYSKCS